MKYGNANAAQQKLIFKSGIIKKGIIALLLSVTSIAPVAMAQQFHIEKSEAFDEPDYGWNKLLQLKNGNTFFFHAQNKEGIEIVAYDKARKQIAKQTITSELWDAKKLKSSKIAGLYEINGEPVLFLAQADGRQPVLYRLRINPATATVIKEEELGSLPKDVPFGGWAIKYGHADPNDIIVEKDPASDCYAVIFFNGFAHDRSERIKVNHYDGTHKMITEAFYESPGGQFKYLRYIGAVVDGNKRLYVTTYGHNGKSDDDAAARVIVSCLTAGRADFKHNLLNFSEDFDDTKSVMLYNRNNNKIQLLTLSLTGKKHGMFSGRTTSYYSTLISYIDPETLAVTNVKPVLGAMTNDYVHKNIDADYNYNGIVQQMVINKDNTTTIMMEENTTETTTNQNGTIVSQKTYLGPVGISELSDTGAELRGYAINKKQMVQGIMPKLYVSGRGKGIYQPVQQYGLVRGNVNQFMSFDYINASKGRYVIFNDLPSNYEKGEDERKRKLMSSVSESNTICFKLNDGNIEKFFLFGEPGEKASTFCYIEASDFNKDISTYATMIVERTGRDKQTRIAWITFE